MESNKDEAVRAKKIAERKFLAKDIKGAKKFALKAKNLYPELEGISQLVTTLEVYICAEEEKIHGESNWYGVLGVTPLADEETIKKQYKKLAFLLHPDKNRSIGAEGAFQLVSQAWSLLSTKSKRTAYDQRQSATSQQKNQKKTQNGFYYFANTAASKGRVPKGNTKRNPSSGPYPSRKKEHNTFWTFCNRCKMQYEYLRMYLNHNLLCPNCHEAYFAVEISPPSANCIKISSLTSNSQKWKNTSQQGSDATRNNSASQCGISGFNHSNGSNYNNFEWVPFSESTDTQSAFQASNMVQQAYEKVKRERSKAQTVARREEALQRKNLASKRTMEVESYGHPNVTKRRKEVEDSGLSKETVKQVSCENGMHRKVNMSDCKQNSLQKCTSKQESVHDVDYKQLLMVKARAEISNKLNERISATAVSTACEDVLENTTKNQTTNLRDGSVAQGSIRGQNKLCGSEETRSQFHLNKPEFGSSGPFLDIKLIKQMSVDVLDSDFHDFDKDRREKCFKDNQVWAMYDDDDGMPRYYAMIHNVISLNPFKVRMSWLSSVTNSRMGHISWFLNGFSRTCGEFRIGRPEICESVYSFSFSHSVSWMNCTYRTLQIYPRKGDVWALYRNWSTEWNELTEYEVIHKYDIVEVLEDYDEELGVIVIPLVKVAGFRAVFHKHLDPMEIQRIANEEMSRFSHQVPSHLLTGKERSKSPRGCRELDPAATPPEILQAIRNIEEKEIELLEADKEIEFVKAVDPDGNAVMNMVEVIS